MFERLLSRNSVGLIAATALAAVAAVVLLTAGAVPNRILNLSFQVFGALILFSALALAAASVRHLVLVARYAARFPPPGRLVDVGGYRMHYVAAGVGAPTVVWIPGSHSQGLAMNHLHRRTAQFTRSIIFDRPSSGWSDVGPFPRTILREARELEAMLRAASEKPPFVIAAHSFGGALATTFADLFPEQIAGLVLLDVTTPDASVYANSLQRKPGAPGLGIPVILAAALGLHWSRLKRATAQEAELYADLADVSEAILANDAQPKLAVGFHSALHALWREPLGMAKGYHALGDIPIIALIPHDVPFATVEQLRAVVPHVSDYLARGFIRNYRDAQESVGRLSRHGEVRLAPPGGTHAIPYEVPDLVIDLVREMVDSVRAKAKGLPAGQAPLSPILDP